MGREYIILLVEDLADDVRLIREAFERAGVPFRLLVAGDGEEAVFYLSGQGKFSNREAYPVPDLVLLDLKMPRMDGFEVLKWIRHNPEVSGLRVIVLTSSEEIRDANHAYKLGANSFLVKPMDFQNFAETSRMLRDYLSGIGEAPASWPPPAAGPPPAAS